MKLKDYVFDKENCKATIWLDEVNPIQLENLLLILREGPKEPQNEVDYNTVIFGEE